MEAQINKISQNYVTQDKLEAEIAKAELRAFKEGKDTGYKKGAFVFGSIGAVCVVASLLLNLISLV